MNLIIVYYFSTLYNLKGNVSASRLYDCVCCAEKLVLICSIFVQKISIMNHNDGLWYVCVLTLSDATMINNEPLIPGNAYFAFFADATRHAFIIQLILPNYEMVSSDLLLTVWMFVFAKWYAGNIALVYKVVGD